MLNKIKRYFQRKQEKREAEGMKALAGAFDSLHKLERSGMLTFDVKERRLFIEEPLASVMAVSAENWRNFIQNVFFWLYWRQCQESWDKFMLREELQAVRRAKRKYVAITHADMMRIRHARRDAIAQSDMEPPKVEPFEFFVVRTVDEKPQEKKKNDKPSGEILVVGRYDYDSDSLEMADWQSVSDFISRKEK